MRLRQIALATHDLDDLRVTDVVGALDRARANGLAVDESGGVLICGVRFRAAA